MGSLQLHAHRIRVRLTAHYKSANIGQSSTAWSATCHQGHARLQCTRVGTNHSYTKNPAQVASDPSQHTWQRSVTNPAQACTPASQQGATPLQRAWKLSSRRAICAR